MSVKKEKITFSDSIFKFLIVLGIKSLNFDAFSENKTCHFASQVNVSWCKTV